MLAWFILHQMLLYLGSWCFSVLMFLPSYFIHIFQLFHQKKSRKTRLTLSLPSWYLNLGKDREKSVLYPRCVVTFPSIDFCRVMVSSPCNHFKNHWYNQLWFVIRLNSKHVIASTRHYNSIIVTENIGK